jgi:L-rhamnose mutarotase
VLGVRRGLHVVAVCDIRNYSIYHKDGLLFFHFEYTGDAFTADMARLASDPEMQLRWAVCKPL